MSLAPIQTVLTSVSCAVWHTDNGVGDVCFVQDRKNSGSIPSGARGNQSASLPPLGGQSASLPPLGGPGMVHPHPNYGISPSEGFHSAGGRLSYGPPDLSQLNMPMQMGPPLFMPGE